MCEQILGPLRVKVNIITQAYLRYLTSISFTRVALCTHLLKQQQAMTGLDVQRRHYPKDVLTTSHALNHLLSIYTYKCFMGKWKLINQSLAASISLSGRVYLILSLELWRCNLLTCDQEFSLPGQSPPPRHCTARSPSVPDSSIKQKTHSERKMDICMSLSCICVYYLTEKFA